MVIICLDSLVDFAFFHLCDLSELSNRRFALVLLLKLTDFCTNLTQCTYLVQRQANNTALLGNSLENALANPPHSIRYELEAAGLVKLLGCLNKTNVTLINQVGECKALVLVLFCNRHYESQISCYQFVLSTFTFGATLFNLLGKLDFLVNGYQWGTTDLYQILV